MSRRTHRMGPLDRVGGKHQFKTACGISLSIKDDIALAWGAPATCSKCLKKARKPRKRATKRGGGR